MSTFKKYIVWRRQHQPASKWMKTAHSVNARTDIEAHSKVGKMFQAASFSSMSLVAVQEGIDPNEYS